ncbi:hypothetical protein BU14_0031s0050, partial [Porphyra umbilicalis]
SSVERNLLGALPVNGRAGHRPIGRRHNPVVDEHEADNRVAAPRYQHRQLRIINHGGQEEEGGRNEGLQGKRQGRDVRKRRGTCERGEGRVNRFSSMKHSPKVVNRSTAKTSSEHTRAPGVLVSVAPAGSAPTEKSYKTQSFPPAF